MKRSNHVSVIRKGRKCLLLLARDTKQTPFIHAKLFQTARSQAYLFHSFVRLSKTSQIPQREWHSWLSATDTLNWQTMQTMQRPVSSRCFLRLKRHTTTLRNVCCTIGAGRLPWKTTTALRSYTWWLSPKCIWEKTIWERSPEGNNSKIHLGVSGNPWSARHVSMKERNSYQ